MTKKVALFIIKYYKLILLCSTMLTIVSILLAKNLKFKYNYQDLLPEDSHSVKVLNEVSDKIGGIGYVTLIITTNNIEKGKKYVEAIGKEIEKLDEIRFVDYRTDVNFFKKNALLYVEIEDLKEILNRLKKVRDYEKKALNPFFIDLENEKVELNFDDIIQKYSKEQASINADIDGFYVSKDKKRILLLAKPKGLASNLSYAKKVVQQVKEAVNKVDKKQFADDIIVEYTDRYVILPIENQTINNDIKKFAILAFLGVLIFIALYTRRKISIILVGIPLIYGLIWTYAIAFLILGHINLVTGSLIGILSGLGIDFGCLLLTRYLFLKSTTKNIEELIEQLLKLSGKSVIGASLVEASAFFSLYFTTFRGFKEFGIIAGIGLIICMISMILNLPCIIVIIEKYLTKKISNNLYTEKIPINTSFIIKYKYPLAIINFTIIILVLILSHKISFEYNFRNLQVKNLRELKLQDIANDTLGLSLTPNPIITKDEKENKEITKILLDNKNKLIQQGQQSTIDKVLSMATLIPENQEEKLNIINQIKEVVNDKIFSYLRGEEAKKFNQLREITEPKQITKDNLPIEITRLFTGVDNKNSSIIWVFPKVLLWDVNNSKAFVEEIRAINKDRNDPVDVSGESFILSDIMDLIKTDGVKALILATIFVIIVLFLLFKEIKAILYVKISLIISLIYLFLIMAIFNIKINIVNMVMFPVIIGLGMAYSIYLYFDYKITNNIFESLNKIFPGIFLSAGTTIIGFGALLISHHQGLASIGLLAVIEISCCFLGSTIFLPFLINIIEKKRES